MTRRPPISTLSPYTTLSRSLAFFSHDPLESEIPYRRWGHISRLGNYPFIKTPPPRFDGCRSNGFSLSLLHVFDPPCRLFTKRHTARNSFGVGEVLGCIGSALGNDFLCLPFSFGFGQVSRPGGWAYLFACVHSFLLAHDIFPEPNDVVFTSNFNVATLTRSAGPVLFFFPPFLRRSPAFF